MPLRGTRYGLVVVVLTQDKVTWSWSFLSKCRCGVGIHSLHAHGLIGKVATWASGNRSRGRGCHGGELRKVLDGACQRDAPVAGEGPGSGIRSTTSLMLRGAGAWACLTVNLVKLRGGLSLIARDIWKTPSVFEK
jgi:hypothetical protein